MKGAEGVHQASSSTSGGVVVGVRGLGGIGAAAGLFGASSVLLGAAEAYSMGLGVAEAETTSALVSSSSSAVVLGGGVGVAGIWFRMRTRSAKNHTFNFSLPL